MTAPPTLYVRLAVAKAIGDAAKGVQDATKAALGGVMDAGDRKTASHDGRDVGTISYAKASPSAAVTDREAFTAWARDTYPTEVRVPITVDADTLMAAFLHLRGDKPDLNLAPDQRTAQANRWAHAFANVMVTITAAQAVVSPAWEASILAAVVKAKAPVDPRTGEMIPGVEYRPGGDGLHITARVSDAQREAIAALWQEGKLDLVELATVPPPALEASA